MFTRCPTYRLCIEETKTARRRGPYPIYGALNKQLGKAISRLTSSNAAQEYETMIFNYSNMTYTQIWGQIYYSWKVYLVGSPGWMLESETTKRQTLGCGGWMELHRIQEPFRDKQLESGGTR